MKLRRLNPEDFLPMQNNMNIAFRFDRQETPVDTNNEVEHSYGAFTDDGKMTSSVISTPYRCSYWGHVVGMSGIGGVATFPEYRREGHMRHLLPFVLKASYDKGDVLSSLFPFSHIFYRKFGYETGAPIQFCEFGMEAFKGFPYIGSVKQFMPGDDKTDIQAIYAAFQKNHNFLVDRDDGYWKHRLDKDPYVTHHHTYVWYDETGAAQAYCLFEHAQDGDKKIYSILDWAYTSPKALHGLFGFFKLLTPSGESIRFKLPADANLFAIFQEPYDISVNVRNCGMFRVINAAEALRLHPWPADLTGFTVRVHDTILPENDHTYRVDCSGQTTVTIDDSAEADLELSIQALSQLLPGAMDLPTLLSCRQDIQLHRPSDTLLKAFPTNPCFLIENF